VPRGLYFIHAQKAQTPAGRRRRFDGHSGISRGNARRQADGRSPAAPDCPETDAPHAHSTAEQRRGLIPSEDELDLHGLTQMEARDQLADFIAHSRDAGRRCVRVVHGKGYRSGARGPILKTAVNLWLRRHLDVVAFTSAKAIDGGTGAVYVLLRA
jgi:DNA-nicking Smr family endonuclease